MILLFIFFQSLEDGQIGVPSAPALVQGADGKDSTSDQSSGIYNVCITPFDSKTGL